MYDVIALGELLIDFTANGQSDQGNGLFEANPGGAPCNVLSMLSNLGRHTAFVGKVGEDMFGRLLKDTIEDVGIDSLALTLDPAAHTTLAFVRNAPDGDREFSFYRDPGADEMLRSDELPLKALADTRIFHFGTLSLTREPVRSATRAAVKAARAGGALISLDPNLRESLWENLEDGKRQMLWGCSVCDILKIAEEELEFLTGLKDIDMGVAKLRADYPNIKLLLVTKGKNGSLAYLDELKVERTAYPQNAIDTTGAGDTFCACCLHYVLEYGLDGLDEARLSEMLQFANAAAGLITTKKGAIRSMPELSDIRDLMDEGGMSVFERRLEERRDELEWLYMELYNDRWHLDRLEEKMRSAYQSRNTALRHLDRQREKNPGWYRSGNMLGITMYTNLFAGNLRNLEKRLDYLAEQGITYLHLMPLLKMPHPDNDGGYAVEDFNQVDPPLGTNEDLAHLTAAMRERGMSLCLDFVINHTADTHEWAIRAKAGEQEYIDRYICYDTPDIPREMEKTIPDVFPETAPGSFIYQPQMHKYVCSSFHPYQWDLNYRTPAVFNDMTTSMLHLANLGVEVMRIDAVPYLWKEIGTTCRNLPQVHTLMRMIRLITEIVCPGVILKGEVVMAPEELAPYFGTSEKPECHLLYNATTMATQWSALATADVRQLKRQLDDLHSLPSYCYFVNYLRCHDDIGWGLNEEYGKTIGLDPVEHKKYLYQFFEGKFPNSFARGERYNYNPQTQDARTCGTTASLCGIEKGLYEKDEPGIAMGIQRDLMMHAAMMSMAGFPMLSSGDEIGQLNGYDYYNDPVLREDNRNIHRTPFNWENAALRKEPNTVQQRIWDGLRQLEQLRSSEPCFGAESSVSTWDSHNRRVLALVRRTEHDTLVCLFNFSGEPQFVTLDLMAGDFKDLISGTVGACSQRTLQPYQYCLCKRMG